MLMVYLVARFWGALLPYLAELGIAADGHAGMRTALLYLANILGSALGAILTGFVLMDHLGLVGIAVALVVAGLALRRPAGGGAEPAAMAEIPARGRGGCAWRAGGARGSADGRHVLENLQWKGSADAKPFVQVVENRSGIITVDRDGTVFGHGMYDGRFNTDLKHDTNGIVRPYALSLFHPAPRDVLMIGLSSGSWAQVIANNPDVAVAHRRRDQSGLSHADRAGAGSRLGAEQSQGHDRHRRRPPLAARQSRPALRRHRLEHDLALPRQRHQPALGRVPRPHQGRTSIRAASSSTTPPAPTACSAPAVSPSRMARASPTTWWCRRRRSPGISRAGGARSKPTGSTASRCSIPPAPRTARCSTIS